jgi:uncharacterized membrane protein YoaK (UPF0700 family)
MADELIRPTPASDRSAIDAQAADRSRRARARSAEWLAAALALIAGFVDAYGMITYGVYVSFMSGNTTQTGYQAAEGAFGPASLSALAILFFVVGSFAGTLLAHFAGRHGRRVVFGAVAAALTAIVVLRAQGFVAAGAHIPTISFAMGIMNCALSRVGAQAVSLTFVTGALSRALLLALLWLGFLVGAFLSGAVTPRYGAPVLAVPALILALLAAFDRPEAAAG